MKDVNAFLAECRECKRAFAVKLDLLGYSHVVIEELLDVSSSFIRKWRNQYERHGVDCFYLQYRGSQGYLSPEDRAEVLRFLTTKEYYRVEELREYVKEQYDVTYKSKQSYYDLLHEAHISWKKTEASNPARDEATVVAKREALKKTHHPSRGDCVGQTGGVYGR
jgi:transposase